MRTHLQGKPGSLSTRHVKQHTQCYARQVLQPEGAGDGVQLRNKCDSGALQVLILTAGADHLCACVAIVQDAVALIKDVAEADKAAEQLVHEAYLRGSNDNISCVVLKFKF